MTPAEAIDIVATHVIANGAQRFAEEGGWGHYPEVGENDWDTVVDRTWELAPYPNQDRYDEAYALLAARAETSP